MRRGASSFLVLTAVLEGAGDPIQDAFDRLYNFDFRGAHRIADSYIATQPADPLGHAVRAAAYLFSELDRLKILQGEFFTDDKRISGNEKLKPDPVIRGKFFAALDETQRLAAARGEETKALFSLALSEGMRMDYLALIEKRQIRSLVPARRAQHYAVEILRRDPGFADAYLTTGFSEYLLGSLPFFIRWFVRMEGAEGNKQQSFTNLERTAAQGRYLGPFARILLAIMNVREKQRNKAITLLEGLTRDYPENSLLRDELKKLRAR